MSRRPRFIAAAAVAALASAFGAPPASAGVWSNCGNPDGTPVFAPWLDTTNYFLAPDGGFEAGAAGWELDGAAVVDGNESYAVSGPGSSSLALGAGDAATSPRVCVGLEHPTYRFFVRKAAGGLDSSLRVQVVLADGTPITVGQIGGSASWEPSPILLVGANLLPLVTGGTSTDVAFRFVPQGGSWQIDDVYVDPRGGN